MTVLEEEHRLIGKLDSSETEQVEPMESNKVGQLDKQDNAFEAQESDSDALEMTSTVADMDIPHSEAPSMPRPKPASRNREWISLQMRSLAVLLYLSCLYCHIPILLSDLHRWTLQGKIPYLAAFTSLPENVKSKLAKNAYRKYESMIRPRVSQNGVSE